MMRYIVIAKRTGKQRIELREVGPVEEGQVGVAAQVAHEKGFHLLWEFSEKPDMREVMRRVDSSTGGVSRMETMLRVWVLCDEKTFK